MRVLSALLILVSINVNAALSITMLPYNDACGNGTGWIGTVVTGGAGSYTYLWSPAPPTGQGTSVARDLVAGTYTVTVTDAAATQVIGTATITTIGTLLPGNTASGSATSCDGACNGNGRVGTFALAWGGLSPYTVSMSPGGSGYISGTYVNVSGLCPGTSYTCTVTDLNGCTSTISNIEVNDLATPILLTQTVSGSCAGGETGSVVLEYDQDVEVGYWSMITGSWTSYNVYGTLVTLENLAPGNHSITAFPHIANGGQSPQYCGVSTTIIIPVSPSPCGSIDGTVYVDFNTDCIQDPTDVAYPQRIIELQPGNHFMLTNSSGQYATELFYGLYDANVGNVNDYTPVCPAVVPAPFTLNAITPSATIDFALDPILGPDVEMVLIPGTPRPGFPMSYTLHMINNGPYNFSPFDATLAYDPIMAYTTSSVAPTVNNPGFLQFAVVGLVPFGHQVINVQLSVPANPLLIGTFFDATATLLPVPADAIPANDAYFVSNEVLGAYDPNDKQAVTSSHLSRSQYFLDVDDHIDYTIRFQNTGNAEAINVQLVDTLSSMLDIGSLELLAATHPYEARLVSDSILIFEFNNILLPDSGADLAGSQGSVSFRIKPKQSFAFGETLANFADIYFDLNPPIRTNTTELIADLSTGISARVDQGALNVWPNPTASELTIQVSQALVGAGRWMIHDAFGRLVYSGTITAGSSMLRLSVEDLATGVYALEVADIRGSSTARFVKR